MADGKEQSFGQIVVLRAWFAAWRFFESKTRDAILFIALFVSGGVVYYRLYGWPATKEQVVPVLIFTVGPIVVLWLLLFIWHLWLAPAAITYEAVRLNAIKPSPSQKPRSTPKPINWAIWRQMDQWTIQQFAAILAHDDPALLQVSAEQSAFCTAILAAARSDKLPYIKERRQNYSGNTYYASVALETKITKAEAIKWADAHEGFDVSHVR